MHPDTSLGPMLAACRLLDRTARDLRATGIRFAKLRLAPTALTLEPENTPSGISSHQALAQEAALARLPDLHRRLMGLLGPVFARVQDLDPRVPIPDTGHPITHHPLAPLLEANGHGSVALRVGSARFKPLFQAKVAHNHPAHAALGYALFLSIFAQGAAQAQGKNDPDEAPRMHKLCVLPRPTAGKARRTFKTRHTMALEIHAHHAEEAVAMCEALCQPHRYLAAQRGARVAFPPTYVASTHHAVPLHGAHAAPGRHVP